MWDELITELMLDDFGDDIESYAATYVYLYFMSVDGYQTLHCALSEEFDSSELPQATERYVRILEKGRITP